MSARGWTLLSHECRRDRLLLPQPRRRVHVVVVHPRRVAKSPNTRDARRVIILRNHDHPFQCLRRTRQDSPGLSRLTSAFHCFVTVLLNKLVSHSLVLVVINIVIVGIVRAMPGFR